MISTLTVGLGWWPLDSYDEMPTQLIRKPFARFRTLTPPIMREGERRIRTVVGPDEPITIDHQTIRSLAGRRRGLDRCWPDLNRLIADTRPDAPAGVSHDG